MNIAAVFMFCFITPNHIKSNLPKTDNDKQFGNGDKRLFQGRRNKEVFLQEEGHKPMYKSDKQRFFANAV